MAGQHHLLGWDNVLKSAGVGGFTTFVLSSELLDAPDEEWDIDGEQLEQRPASLAIHLDQGPVTWATLSYLQHIGMNYVFHYDPSHRMWNDVKEGLVQGGMWPMATLLQIAANMDYGPWEGKEFHERGAAAADHFVAHGDANHPLIEGLAAGLMRELKVEYDGHFEVGRSALWRAIQTWEVYRVKSRKVAMSRWFGLLRSARKYTETWYQRLLVLLWIGVTYGWTGVAKAQQTIRRAELKKRLEKASEAVDVSTVKGSKNTANVMRGCCANTLHLVMVMMLEPSSYRKANFMHIFQTV